MTNKRNNRVKTESLEFKRKRMDDAYKFWEKNNHLNIEQLCEARKITEPSFRAYFKRYQGGKRPDGQDFTKKSDRQHHIARAYEKGLGDGLTAAEAAKWASAEHTSRITRADIQYYAMKHDLPLLEESQNVQLFNSNKKY